MARDTLRRCSACGEMHWLSQWPDNHREAEPRRSSLPSPMVISDTIDPVRSMADGKEYTSKAALRSTYKPSGNPDGISYVEVGNEKPTGVVKPKVDEKAIQESLNKALARYERGERVNPS
jgi:hypothetical protein